MIVATEATFECGADWHETGLVGTIGVKIDDGAGNIVHPRQTAGIQEVDLGVYQVTLPTPTPDGQYRILWDVPGEDAASEDLFVQLGADPLPDIELPPSMPTGDPTLGPCTAWTTAEDVAVCLGITVDSSNSLFLDQVAVEASMLLYEKSGRQYSGGCEMPDARPCADPCDWCGQVLSRGHLVGWDGSAWEECGTFCGCSPSPTVKLPGYPVTEITLVAIDGETIDPNAYILLNYQDLVRVDGNRWPRCQNMTAGIDEAGSFVVRYRSGVNPPPVGQRAAAQLAAHLALACPSDLSGAEGECLLPAGTTSLNRLGVTINIDAFTGLTFLDGRWQTGLLLVDEFLNTYNPRNQRRRAMVYSPDGPPFAQLVPDAASS